MVDGLVIIFNKSFQEGCFPGVLKLAKVIPIHKGDETTDPTDYRPISLLSVFDKLIEKVMPNRLLKFLKKNNILYKYQFGLRKNHATTHALTEVIDHVYKSLMRETTFLEFTLILRKHLILYNIRYVYKSFNTMEYERSHWIGLIPTYQIENNS